MSNLYNPDGPGLPSASHNNSNNAPPCVLNKSSEQWYATQVSSFDALTVQDTASNPPPSNIFPLPLPAEGQSWGQNWGRNCGVGRNYSEDTEMLDPNPGNASSQSFSTGRSLEEHYHGPFDIPISPFDDVSNSSYDTQTYRGRSPERTNPPRSGSASSIASSVSCGSCFQKFTRPDVRKRHEDNMHSSISTEVTCGGTALGWGCGKVYKNKRTLKDHWTRESKTDGTGIACSMARDELSKQGNLPSHAGFPAAHQRNYGSFISSSQAEARFGPIRSTRLHADGYLHCPHVGSGVCSHKPTRSKSVFCGYIDAHTKPFICRNSGCMGSDRDESRFSSAAGLVRHEREVHGIKEHFFNKVFTLIQFSWLAQLHSVIKSHEPTNVALLSHDPLAFGRGPALILEESAEFIKKIKLRNKDLELKNQGLELKNKDLELRNRQLEFQMSQMRMSSSETPLKDR